MSQRDSSTPILDTSRWQRLQWVKDSRFYEVELQQDLWGQWVLTRRWGQRGSPCRHHSDLPCESYEQALESFQQAIQRRRQRGYELIKKGRKARMCLAPNELLQGKPLRGDFSV